MTKTFQLTAAQQKFLDGLSDSEKKRVMSQPIDAQAAHIDLMLKVNATLAGFKLDDNLVVAGELNSEVELFSFNKGGGFAEGSKLRLELLGTMPMWKNTPSDGWEEIEVKGQKVSISKHFRAIVRMEGHPLNGKEIGIYDGASLNVLTKIPTLATTVGTPQANPIITLDYIEFAQGKDNIKAKYGIELKSGTSMHVINVLYSPAVAATVRQYEAGCVNFLKNPVPTLKDPSKVKLSTFEKQVLSYACNKGLVAPSATVEQAQKAIDDFEAGRIQAGHASRPVLENSNETSQLAQ